MTKTAERIKLRRKALGLSQTALAQKLGYSDKTAISKLERSVNGVNDRILPKLAQELQTTTDYLTGLVDDPSIWNTPLNDDRSVTDSEFDLICKFRTLPETEQKKIEDLIETSYQEVMKGI